MTREIGSLWKTQEGYKVQFPKGIATFRLKKVAEDWQDLLIKEGYTTFLKPFSCIK